MWEEMGMEEAQRTWDGGTLVWHDMRRSFFEVVQFSCMFLPVFESAGLSGKLNATPTKDMGQGGQG